MSVEEGATMVWMLSCTSPPRILEYTIASEIESTAKRYNRYATHSVYSSKCSSLMRVCRLSSSGHLLPIHISSRAEYRWRSIPRIYPFSFTLIHRWLFTPLAKVSMIWSINGMSCSTTVPLGCAAWKLLWAELSLSM